MIKSKSEKPNVIIFFTDQQRWDTTGVHGNPLDLTTNFDRMATFGTHIYHSFTCQPVCGPARSCLQTGLYATKTGCFRNSIPLPANTKTIANYFKEVGYKTGYIGKWHLSDEDPVPKSKRFGYDYWLAANILEFVSEPYDTILYNNDNEEVHLPGYRVDALTDAAIRYMDKNRDNPFFLFLSFLEPHHQNHIDDYPAPEGYREKFSGKWLPPDLSALGGSTHQHIGGYYGMVKRLDEALGRILDALKSLHLTENTIVLFTSDHGCHFKTRNDEYKRSGHESSIRVPTAITGPGFIGGRKIMELVSLIDLPPTLLDAAGIPIPADMQGRSLMPLIRNEVNDWHTDVFVQISESQVGRAIRTRKWKYGIVTPNKDGNIYDSSDTYIESYLYDLESDPYELRNLVGFASHSEVAKIMRERLLKRMTEAGEEAPVIQLLPPIPSGQRRVSKEEVML
ncbi:sulfatase-like hydrolase/transferase [Fodinisporobacter ferrooxydans]|uniref:Sulfatase-like hydrolase/transferase n=1 Tax=Fodinisporobacter ferrooxydans TaxID=2901836 RepID=A0ABY4CDY0_9BACL|nr:sulfatase-like hydrolase/transferase [Alicyclobacillaceae bacterium MYW30-H2]